MNLVDSSCWLEYFAGSVLDEEFLEVIRTKDRLIIPSIVVLEVFRRIISEFEDTTALKTCAAMTQGARIADLNVTLAMDAARLGRRHKLPLADAVIYATARSFDATLWTQDAHFEGLDGVRYLPRLSPADGGGPSSSP